MSSRSASRLPRAAARHEGVKRVARALLCRMPALERRVKMLLARPVPLPPRRMHVPLDSKDLSPTTRLLYQELKSHFETRKS